MCSRKVPVLGHSMHGSGSVTLVDEAAWSVVSVSMQHIVGRTIISVATNWVMTCGGCHAKEMIVLWCLKCYACRRKEKHESRRVQGHHRGHFPCLRSSHCPWSRIMSLFVLSLLISCRDCIPRGQSPPASSKPSPAPS